MCKEIIQNLIEKTDKLEVLNEIAKYIEKNGKISSDDFIKELIKVLDDDNDFVRIKATEIAENYTDERLVDKLIEKMLNDSNNFVRGFSAKALGTMGNIKAKESLEKAQNDPDGFVVSFVNASLKIITVKASFGNKLNKLKLKMKAKQKL